MKIIHLSHSDLSGGASRGAYRVHNMLVKNEIDSTMWVDIKKSVDQTVIGPESKIRNFINNKRQHLRFPINKLLKSYIFGMHSPSLLPSKWLKKINNSDADIIHLHWIQGEMLSIKDISKINKPLIWSFHDMWPFCGCEHYAYNNRYYEGYTRNNRSKNELWFFDINRWRWMQKVKLFNKPIQIISHSKWMTDCVQKSFLMNNWPIETIPLPIDTSKWNPVEKNFSRKKLNLPQNKKLIIFGATGGVKDPRKGFELLKLALNNLKKLNSIDDLNLVVFGGSNKNFYSDIDMKIHDFHEINDDSILQKLYSASDLMVVPSKLEAFGQTAIEALACGTPVVAFSGTGLSDIIEHKKTGYLAKSLNENDLADGINWVLKNSFNNILSTNSRSRAKLFFSEDVIIKKYFNIYSKLLKK
jgi:glycosyltransferase involved in cell wall biosynthesis